MTNVNVEKSFAYVREKSIVTLECKIIGNPEVNEILWLFNGKHLLVTLQSNVLIANHTLVIQKVNRNNGGKYQCMASNDLGNATSNSILIIVQCN
jgi:hypothetical protein